MASRIPAPIAYQHPIKGEESIQLNVYGQRT